MGLIMDFCKKRQKNRSKVYLETAKKEYELVILKDSENRKKKFINNFSYLYESKIGFYNAGGSCYMDSIIQILIHLKSFVEKFRKKI